MTDSEKLDLLIESVGKMKEDVKGLKEDMRRREILCIAAGCSGSGELPQMLQMRREIELLTLRVNKLDGEMKEVKAKIS